MARRPRGGAFSLPRPEPITVDWAAGLDELRKGFEGAMAESFESSRGLETRVIRDEAALAGLREDWLRLQFHAQADFEHYLSRIANGDAPFVICVLEDGDVRALLAGLCRTLQHPSRIGYRTVARPQARTLEVVEGAVMGDRSPEVAERFYQALDAALRSGVADLVRFHCLPKASPLYALLRSRPALWRRDPAAEEWLRFRLHLPADFASFLASRSANTRNQIRRTRKRFEEALGERAQIRCYRRPEESEKALHAIESISPYTYQTRLGVGYTDRHRTGKLDGFERGRLEVWVLYVDGEPRAFWDGIRYQGSLTIWHTGYDPALSDLRPGNYLLLALIESLCQDDEICVIDFGAHEAQYKRSYASVVSEEAKLRLYGTTPRALWLAILAGTIASLDRAAKAFLASTGLRDRVRRWLRRN